MLCGAVLDYMLLCCGFPLEAIKYSYDTKPWGFMVKWQCIEAKEL